MDTLAVRRRLEAMMSDLDQSLATLEHQDAGNASERAVYDQHPADSGSDLSDADRAEAVVEAMERQRAEVRAALERVDLGSYGTCVDCGRPLAVERLEARPEAARCVTCQARHEDR